MVQEEGLSIPKKKWKCLAQKNPIPTKKFQDLHFRQTDLRKNWLKFVVQKGDMIVDLTPEDEKIFVHGAKIEHKSDFVTITHFPTKKELFIHRSWEKMEFSLSYDILLGDLKLPQGSKE